ncbi:lisH domain and HEAT repeat-containing protein KIAA1468 homolog [Lingula anatina]|uniref:LisH domain and HEAT repeat-containing protein KIAA1468 homolog n=1 Tax=Lingula anatina TaxID=7574 RepID=A0A2R2MKD4_LINAN|nr:lisH domain and HEAT repeat-containing protein KIAA1468 homolog [Lingula anatina]|eukprot:XP_023930663.1 lisH domain and HEAT repeat-containing protein KIAA1468 homolog [Lingula anatina]
MVSKVLNPSNHELLLAVLWDGVVHTSAQVRSTTGKIFEVLVKGVSESLIASRVVPALVTLASDPEISVRISTVPAFGTVVENVTQREILDKVHMQFQTFMDDPLYRDQHSLYVSLINTFARVGPNAEPKFRDEFVLPRLAVMAATNNHTTNETRKRDVAMQLWEAYSALSCCFINEQLISEAMLPGLRCLRQDMAQVAPELESVVSSLIKDFETKVEAPRPLDRSGSISAAVSAVTGTGADNMKTKMMNTFKDIKDKSTSSRANIASIFRKK